MNTPLLRSPRLWGGLVIGGLIGMALGAAVCFGAFTGNPDATIRMLEARKASSKPSGPATAAGPAKNATVYPVEIGTVVRRAAQRSIVATGSIEAFETVRVAARVAGVVETVAVAEGDVVALGQVLAEIEPKRYRIALDTAEAQVAGARSRLADATAVLDRRTAAERTVPGTVSAEDLATQQQRVAQATADLAVAVAARDRAALDLDDARVKAPVPGIVQTRDIQTGAALAIGSPVATLVRREPLLVRFPVQVADAAGITTGATIQVAVQGVTMSAVIQLVSEAADRRSRQVTVVARLPSGTPVRAGSFAEITIPLTAGSDDTLVPELAVRPSERGFLVYRLRTDGRTVDEMQVAIGGRTTDGQVIVRGPLAAGDRIVVRGAEALVDAAAISYPDMPAGPATAAR